MAARATDEGDFPPLRGRRNIALQTVIPGHHSLGSTEGRHMYVRDISSKDETNWGMTGLAGCNAGRSQLLIS